MNNLFVQDSEDEELQNELSHQLEDHETTDNELQAEPRKDSTEDLPVEASFDVSTNLQEELDSRINTEQPLYPLIPNAPEGEDNLEPNIGEIRAVNVNLNLPLNFQQRVVENVLVAEDPLVILGNGLGIGSIVANLLHVLSTPTVIDGVLKRSLVFVLNTSTNDNKILEEQLQELSWIAECNQVKDESNPENTEIIERPFTIVTADSHIVEKRRKLYSNGGIVSVTSRILIVDLLAGVVHPDKITGMVVLNVDALKEYSNESFILDIYRSKNKWGFIKAFSENAEAFTMEFSPLKRKLKELRLKNVLLWPRFRVEVSSCLNAKAEEKNSSVIEVRVSMTNTMSQIEFGLIGCLKRCIAELNRKNPELARDWWTSEHMLEPNFLKSIDAVMMPNWHRISHESKQLIKDIRYLKNLTKALVSFDAVDFYEEIQVSLEANKPSVTRKYTESPWLMADESQLVISYARKRIYTGSDYLLEELPKWEQLLDILKDIEYKKSINDSQGPILIMCSTTTICVQLSKILAFSHKKSGIRNMMMRKLHMYKYRREEQKKMVKEVREKEAIPTGELNVSTTFVKEQVNSNRRRTRGTAVVASVERLKASGVGENIEEAIDNFEYENEIEYITENQHDENFDDIVLVDVDEKYDEFLAKENISSYEKTNVTEEMWNTRISNIEFVSNADEIIIEKYSNINDDLFLQELMPSFIIMYEPDLNFVRKVELYNKVNEYNPPQIYFMYYGDSFEEQNHLSAIKREKDAFSKLIRENATLAHHFETEEDLSNFKNLAERRMKINRLRRSNTRKAGGQSGYVEYTQDIVVVDTREFGASLPGLLFRYGVRVIPCMLTVGDYILTPDICVERKSISDLIGSLQNNRLVSQCKKMSKHYRYPTLLIEFEPGQSFSLEPFSERRNYRSKQLSTTHPISSKLSQDEIQMKISKLVMQFPNLKIIWSSSPLQTVNIILELKLGREQPDPNTSVSLGSTAKNVRTSGSENAEDLSILLQIPGISNIDYFNIKKKVKNLKKLKKLSYDQLSDILGDPELAQRVFDFLNKEEEEDALVVEF